MTRLSLQSWILSWKVLENVCTLTSLLKPTSTRQTPQTRLLSSAFMKIQAISGGRRSMLLTLLVSWLIWLLSRSGELTAMEVKQKIYLYWFEANLKGISFLLLISVWISILWDFVKLLYFIMKWFIFNFFFHCIRYSFLIVKTIFKYLCLMTVNALFSVLLEWLFVCCIIYSGLDLGLAFSSLDIDLLKELRRYRFWHVSHIKIFTTK